MKRVFIISLSLFSMAQCFIPSPSFLATKMCHPLISHSDHAVNVNPLPSKVLLRMSASEIDDETSVVAICRDKIKAALETDDVIVTGAYDDPNGSHISIEVTSAQFEGKRPVQRQQLVYKAIWEELQGAVHAVDSMICKSPSEA